MKVLLKVFLWLFVIIVILFLVGFLLPKSVYVERSTTINTSPDAVFALANDLKTYDKWMPWNQKDPNWKVQYGDQTKGEGSWYEWQSNDKNVGNGKLTIIESQPGKKVVTKLDFEGSDSTTAGWEFKPSGNGTEVKWYINSNMGNNPVYRWIGLFMPNMIGPEFEKGLVNMKKVAEEQATIAIPAQSPRMEIEETTVKPMIVLTVMDTAKTMNDIGPALQKNYGDIAAFMKINKLESDGMPLAWYYTEKEPYILEAAIPVSKDPKSLKTVGKIKLKQLPGGKAVVVHFWGPYEETGKAYGLINEWLTKNNQIALGAPYDVYVTDPQTVTDVYQVQTDIYQKIK